MKVKLITPSGKTLQQKIAENTKSYKQLLETNSIDFVRDYIKSNIETLVKNCYVELED